MVLWCSNLAIAKAAQKRPDRENRASLLDSPSREPNKAIDSLACPSPPGARRLPIRRSQSDKPEPELTSSVEIGGFVALGTASDVVFC